MGIDTWVQLNVVLTFDEKASFKACQFEQGEVCRKHVVYFSLSPQ